MVGIIEEICLLAKREIVDSVALAANGRAMSTVARREFAAP